MIFPPPKPDVIAQRLSIKNRKGTVRMSDALRFYILKWYFFLLEMSKNLDELKYYEGFVLFRS